MGLPLKFNFFFQWAILIGPSQNDIWGSTKKKKSLYYSQDKKCGVPPHLYLWGEDNFGKTYGIKVWHYCKHPEGTLWELHGNPMRIWWELIGNIKANIHGTSWVHSAYSSLHWLSRISNFFYICLAPFLT